MKNIWSIISNRAIIDQRDSSLSLYGCIDEITVNFTNPEEIKKNIKNINIIFDIVSLWYDENIKKERKFQYLIEVIDPQNKKVGEFIKEAVFKKNEKRLRTITQINGLTITSEGEYLFKIKYRKDNKAFSVVSEIPISVVCIISLPSNQKKLAQ